METCEVVIGPNHPVRAVRSRARLSCRAQRNGQGTQGNEDSERESQTPIHLAHLSVSSTEREENAGTFCSRLYRVSLCSCPRYRRAYRSMNSARSISLFLRRTDRSQVSLLCRFRQSWLHRQIHQFLPSGDLLQTRYRTCPRFVDSASFQSQRPLRRLPKGLPSS